MTSVVFLIEQLAVGLYLIIGAGVLMALRSLMKSRGAYRATYFELERDIARYHTANALTVLVLLIEAALVVLGVQRIVAPTVRQTMSTVQTIERVAEDGIALSPTPFALEGGAPIDASGVQLEEEDPAQQVLATPTLTPTPVGTIMPNAPEPNGCDTDGARLEVPANGMVVFEPITVIGSADMANFAFYRFEIKGESTFDNFAPREQFSLPVPERGELGNFVPAFYEPGEYQFRLAVFDNTGTLGPSCTITIYISDPIPTPTPLGEGLNSGVAPVATPAAGG